MTLAQDRISKGQCPDCGKEAAPYRLCYDCRQKVRMIRCLKRGEKVGALKTFGIGRHKLYSLNNKDNPNYALASERWGKWSPPIHMPESDGRAAPRLRGIRVDVEATLLEVMKFIGRPCTIEEITAGWGRLREKRSDPLPADLGRIIVAAEKRKAKNARRAAAWEKSQQRVAAE